MDALEDLLALAKTGYFRKLGATPRPPVKPPTTPQNAANDPNPPLTLPAGLSGAIDALTAAQKVSHDVTPFASTRFWIVTRNGRRYFVEFLEPQTLTQLQEHTARNRPGEPIELQPALSLKAVCDNAPLPDTQPPEPAMQQANLLPLSLIHISEPTRPY